MASTLLSLNEWVALQEAKAVCPICNGTPPSEGTCAQCGMSQEVADVKAMSEEVLEEAWSTPKKPKGDEKYWFDTGGRGTFSHKALATITNHHLAKDGIEVHHSTNRTHHKFDVHANGKHIGSTTIHKDEDEGEYVEGLNHVLKSAGHKSRAKLEDWAEGKYCDDCEKELPADHKGYKCADCSSTKKSEPYASHTPKQGRKPVGPVKEEITPDFVRMIAESIG